MHTRPHKFRSYFQLAFSALIVLCLVLQFIYGALLEGGLTLSYVVQFFTYFTILSNILVAVVLSAEAQASLSGRTLSARFEPARGTAVFCILTTGVIYTLFLRGPAGHGSMIQDSIPWINAVFHYVMPAVMLFDWVAFPPKYQVKWISILKWICITVLYFIYVEAIGYITHTYPYFFVDPTKLHGFLHVVLACLTFIPFFVVFGGIVVALVKIRVKYQAER